MRAMGVETDAGLWAWVWVGHRRGGPRPVVPPGQECSLGTVVAVVVDVDSCSDATDDEWDSSGNQVEPGGQRGTLDLEASRRHDLCPLTLSGLPGPLQSRPSLFWGQDHSKGWRSL